MAFSKARRLSDLVSSAGEISSFVDGSITHADLHTNMDLTGKTVLVTTQSASDNDTSAASTAYVTTAISNLVDSAPGTLNTLNEIAAALNDDANFNTTVTNAIAAKLPLAGGTLTGALTGTSATFTGAIQLNDTTLNVHTSSAGAIIGKIGQTANDINIFSTTAGHNGLRMHANGILPTDNTGTIINNDADLGDPNYVFKDLYLGGFAKADNYQFYQNSSATGVTEAIYRKTTGTIAFKTNSTEHMTLDGSGNLSLQGTAVIQPSGASLLPSLKLNNNGYLGSASTPTALQIRTNGTIALSPTAAASSQALFSTGAYGSGQGDNKTHFGYNDGGTYKNYIRGSLTVISSSVEHGATTTMGDVTIIAKNNNYNLKVMAQDGDSWFGVYDDANDSANIIVTRSDTTQSFRHLGHTGETTIKATGTGLRIESTNNDALQIAGNSGGLNFTTGANQRIYFGNIRALEGTSSNTTLQIGEGFTSGLYQMALNTFYGSVIPSAANQYDLGGATLPWRDLYIGDLKLSNETREEGNDVDGTRGNWTIQEGESHLFIINNKNGKKYRFALEEV